MENTENDAEKKDIKKQKASEVSITDNMAKSNVSCTSLKLLRFGSVLRTWVEVSKINYLSSIIFDSVTKDPRLRSSTFTTSNLSISAIESVTAEDKEDDTLPVRRKFPVHLTSLMNESNLWGCFYTFPELYDDAYSPIIRMKNETPSIEEGILSRDMVVGGLSYLKRSPITGDYVYIKLDLSFKILSNIDILQSYKYLVYLDLSSNFLTELNVLSHLPYLQYLSVDFNRLQTVLEYDTPQWFLSEVHYKYNAVLKIRDISIFWSLTILDLSHNNIYVIQGLERLIYLRRLNLSFNNIDRLENLNHLRLLWLDLSNNNISCFECGPKTGLKTLLHLEYLNLNENKLKSLKIFLGCSRLRELHARNNYFDLLLEVPLYMKTMRRLIVLDFRANPLQHVFGYSDVIIKTFPNLLDLDDLSLDPIEVAKTKMDITSDVRAFATRRLLRLLYIQQLSRAKVSPHILPADTTDIPMVVLVGYEAVGKGTLTRRIAAECHSNVELAIQHTTASYHASDHYRAITRRNFDEMLLTGEFLTYSEMDGESYGLSRIEAFVSNGRVKITSMDLIGALMLKLRGLRPYLILASCTDKPALKTRQQERKRARDMARETKEDKQGEKSTLQVLLSGRIIINGILNEMLQGLISASDSNTDFIIPSECSLMQDSAVRRHKNVTGVDRMTLLNPDTSEVSKSSDHEHRHLDSLYSLYKEARSMNEFVSDVYRHISQDISKKNIDKQQESEKEFNKEKSCPGTSQICPSANTSKSVAFTSPQQQTTSEMLRNLQPLQENINLETMNTIRKSYETDLLKMFLFDNNLIDECDLNWDTSCYEEMYINNSNNKMESNICNQGIPSEVYTTTIRDDYEDLHRICPGMFWDTITMDNPKAAFRKLKGIIKHIVESQNKLKPMYDIQWTDNLEDHPTVAKKLENFCHQIAPQQLFY